MARKTVFSVLIPFFLSSGLSIVALADDTPDEGIEGNLHQTYQQSHSKPTAAGAWNAAISVSGVRTYVVKKGETLQDISKLLFGEKKYWTKIWAVNAHVTNPYEIPAGTILKFKAAFMKSLEGGSLASLPMLELVEGQVDREQVAPEVLALTLNVEIPAPLYKSKKVMKTLPESLPSWKFAQTKLLNADLSLERPTPKALENQMPLSYYLSAEEPTTVGEVVQTEMGFRSASEFQQVFIRMDDEEAAAQKSFIAIKEQESLSDKSSGVSGTIIQVQGEVKLLERVNDGDNIYRAVVSRSLSPVEVGAKLSLGDIRYVDVSDSGSSSTANANIIGGQYGNSRKLYSANTLVFLNAGTGAGLTEGTVLPIYKDQSKRTEVSYIEKQPKIIGRLKVVKAESEVSTALILANGEEIQNGDGTSAGSVLPGGAAEE